MDGWLVGWVVGWNIWTNKLDKSILLVSITELKWKLCIKDYSNSYYYTAKLL